MMPGRRCAISRAWMVVCLVLGCLLPGCRTSQGGEAPRTESSRAAAVQGRSSDPGGTSRAARRVRGSPLGKTTVVGKPAIFENLTVFPILARSQTDVGPITSLPLALEQGTAEVRELGDEDAHDARVGTLVVQNRGEIPIYVLAGTVVKGGKQDRQIAQDFIVAPGKTANVDAFCVEHGRWEGQRFGSSTGGKFTAGKQLAHSEVRVAGQYEQDQGKVWSKVGKVNRDNQKRSGTDSLFATLDDAEVARQRDALSARVLRHLARVDPQSSVVGFAYAVDGRIKAVRWFAHHRVFQLFGETLANTSALDAITARGGKPPQRPPELNPEAVTQFIAEVDASRDKHERKTEAENTNEYSKSDKGYGSKTRYKFAPAAPEVDVSSDYAAH